MRIYSIFVVFAALLLVVVSLTGCVDIDALSARQSMKNLPQTYKPPLAYKRPERTVFPAEELCRSTGRTDC
jgi:hypothetical protein